MAGGFSAEVTSLEEAANKALRPLAAELLDARSRLADTRYSDIGFTAGQYDEDGIFAPAGSAWDETRGFLERIFADNAENLLLAAAALLEIAQRYRQADQGAAANLQAIENQGLG
ncbi:hypothetical protein JOF41_001519 [Saccharothrix coeruleofusca]|uniref:hypothetical protein n=1 Tax=Saccharothrix coeruleofusca TaxID=33919 RepID=UPI001AEA4664|nr:hypothetical protein [Saccharothrix coeruleofusca]MBP2335341.1 hypothetical protein [Saccharothrix coeruleofusca]